MTKRNIKILDLAERLAEPDAVAGVMRLLEFHGLPPVLEALRDIATTNKQEARTDDRADDALAFARIAALLERARRMAKAYGY